MLGHATQPEQLYLQLKALLPLIVKLSFLQQRLGLWQHLLRLKFYLMRYRFSTRRLLQQLRFLLVLESRLLPFLI